MKNEKIKLVLISIVWQVFQIRATKKSFFRLFTIENQFSWPTQSTFACGISYISQKLCKRTKLKYWGAFPVHPLIGHFYFYALGQRL